MSQAKNISKRSYKKEDNNDFCKENGFADLTLNVENHRIHVSKTVLCIASPWFRAMLEKSQSEMSLPDKSYKHFVEFLRCIYPDMMKKVTEKNVYMLLPLAHEYNVGKMMKRCEKMLKHIVKNRYTRNVEELYRHIHLSELYSLEELKEICINLASDHTLKQFKAARTAYQISDESHFKIIEFALRRHELDKTDEKNFEVHKNKEYMVKVYTDSENELDD
ncbi:BTB and MATH domain-containing protein 36-like [Ruditapes philippinarum]|uniref:BTB and MATH domain-containing protein 36-like n=1 Tax=Ruditapes philippinarum TaxID=129788 RepID=UPI00295A82CF|nr:BTB and MATH domain-containing protein 36-like [Ruditapes philippinarum]